MMSLGWSLVWTIINLIVLYLLMKKFLIGPVLGIMEKRKACIAKEMEEARVSREKAEELKLEYEKSLAMAKEESSQILENAKTDARQVRESIVKNANNEAAKIIEAAQNTARQEQENAMQAAKKLLLEKSDENSNDILYDKFLAKAGDADDTDSY
jgi:F-type H+-transporting ATPase subunit b